MNYIQRQSIKSFIAIGIGFMLGAVNQLILLPRFLTIEQVGLTRVINDIGLILGTLATLGTLPAIYKFFPFYRHHLKKEENDLPFLGISICLAGCAIMALLVVVLRPVIAPMFEKRSALFVSHYYAVIPFAISFALFSLLEGFAWGTGKMVVSNFLREAFSRFVTTIAALLLFWQLLQFEAFVGIFSGYYLLPALVLLVVIVQTGQFPWVPRLSKVSRRLGGRMISFSSFVFTTAILNIIARTIDGILIASLKDIRDTAVFSLATYFTNLLEIPQRSITSVTIPILAEHWRNKKIEKIRSIYRKSSIELLIIGFALAGAIFLNIPNIIRFLPPGYEGIALPAMILLVAKVIDLGTGINSQIIGTSNFWKFDFATNIVYTLLSIPLNYYLIKQMGIGGAALANLIAIILYNAIRFTFIWRRFGMQPFTRKTLLLTVTGILSIFLVSLIPYRLNLYADALLRTPLYLLLFLLLVIRLNISEDTREVLRNAVKLIRRKA